MPISMLYQLFFKISYIFLLSTIGIIPFIDEIGV